MTKRTVKIIAITLASLVGALVLTVLGYVVYVAVQYYRIEDGKALQINGEAEQTVERGAEYSVLSYNLGFGAYSPEYSFFMDTGEMSDGTKTCGKYAKGVSKEDVEKNVVRGRLPLFADNLPTSISYRRWTSVRTGAIK